MATLAAYMETLSSFSPQIVAEACQTYRRRSTRFPPTAGEVYDRCAELADKREKEARLRLSSPSSDKPEKSPEERERMQKRFQELMAELQQDKGPDSFRANPKQNPVTERRVASQWLERHGAGSNHEVKTVINVSPELEAYLFRAFPQNFEAAE